MLVLIMRFIFICFLIYWVAKGVRRLLSILQIASGNKPAVKNKEESVIDLCTHCGEVLKLGDKKCRNCGRPV